MDIEEWKVSNKTARCNPCRVQHEEAEERMHQSNQAKIIRSSIQPSFCAEHMPQDDLSRVDMVMFFL